ncbi:MAG: hypothetical protein ACD_3C00130G0002 [uncultured bacterium (gcode 4)]|uniref:Uncharacterized protein n=1 Tax=uncultured bacterium (gcode 4) TaxID=1234023 RepID=K2GCC0_9BACT|nr:MAG: hypothetical protein ACD_3C00130G0002 [uncultured bacterium (gcode 4)]
MKKIIVIILFLIFGSANAATARNWRLEALILMKSLTNKNYLIKYSWATEDKIKENKIKEFLRVTFHNRVDDDNLKIYTNFVVYWTKNINKTVDNEINEYYLKNSKIIPTKSDKDFLKTIFRTKILLSFWTKNKKYPTDKYEWKELSENNEYYKDLQPSGYTESNLLIWTKSDYKETDNISGGTKNGELINLKLSVSKKNDYVIINRYLFISTKDPYWKCLQNSKIIIWNTEYTNPDISESSDTNPTMCIYQFNDIQKVIKSWATAEMKFLADIPVKNSSNNDIVIIPRTSYTTGRMWWLSTTGIWNVNYSFDREWNEMIMKTITIK